MPTVNKVRISELVDASRKYVDQQVAKADSNRNGYVTPTEAKRLAVDLQDNFAGSHFKQSWGSVKSADLAREFTVMVEAFAKSADRDGDGFLSITEAGALPKSLQDNFASYLAAQQSKQTDTGGYETKNVTPRGRVEAHLERFGEGAVSYEDALAKAVHALATDEYGLAYFVREYGGPDGSGLEDPAEVDAEVRELLKTGSVELIDVDDDIPTGETNEDAWIFSLSTDGQGDNGIWAIVDRQTGETTVTSFN